MEVVIKTTMKRRNAEVLMRRIYIDYDIESAPGIVGIDIRLSRGGC